MWAIHEKESCKTTGPRMLAKWEAEKAAAGPAGRPPTVARLANGLCQSAGAACHFRRLPSAISAACRIERGLPRLGAPAVPDGPSADGDGGRMEAGRGRLQAGAAPHLPCVSPLPSRLRHRLCLVLPLPLRLRHAPFRAAPQVNPLMLQQILLVGAATTRCRRRRVPPLEPGRAGRQALKNTCR